MKSLGDMSWHIDLNMALMWIWPYIADSSALKKFTWKEGPRAAWDAGMCGWCKMTSCNDWQGLLMMTLTVTQAHVYQSQHNSCWGFAGGVRLQVSTVLAKMGRQHGGHEWILVTMLLLLLLFLFSFPWKFLLHFVNFPVCCCFSFPFLEIPASLCKFSGLRALSCNESSL